MAKGVDHIGIAVKSIDRALSFYTDVLKLSLRGMETVESEGVKTAFFQIGDTTIELLEPISAESPIAKFIAKRGEGIHHVALRVESIQERLDEMKEQGILLLQEKPKVGAHGSLVAFIHPKSAMGVLYELCERKGAEENHD